MESSFVRAIMVDAVFGLRGGAERSLPAVSRRMRYFEGCGLGN